MLELLSIKQTIEENQEFSSNPDCAESLQLSINHYKEIGFEPPWIGYFVKLDGNIVGMAGYIGKPIDNKIEIAYGTVERFRQKGIGTEICRLLVVLAQRTDPDLMITAHTLPHENYSTKILKKNGFRYLGIAWDKDEGDVWEWLFEK